MDKRRLFRRAAHEHERLAVEFSNKAGRHLVLACQHDEFPEVKHRRMSATHRKQARLAAKSAVRERRIAASYRFHTEERGQRDA